MVNLGEGQGGLDTQVLVKGSFFRTPPANNFLGSSHTRPHSLHQKEENNK